MANPIPDIKFTDVELTKFKDYLQAQVIPDPPGELIEIYDKRVLHELSYLRAEKYDSPEWQTELEEEVWKNLKPGEEKVVPRNIQNPNYNKLLKYYHTILKQKSIPDVINQINQLVSFIRSFPFRPPFEFKPGFIVDLEAMDPRLYQDDLNLYLCYLLTRVRISIVLEELKLFNQLTKEAFDQESLNDSLINIKEERNKSQEAFELIGNQLIFLMDSEDQPQKYQLDQSKMIYQLNQIKTLPEFLDYLYFSQS